CAGVGLLFKPLRRTALILAAVMHATLLACLGPWGMDHQPAVLLWNVGFLGQAVLLWVWSTRTAHGAIAVAEPVEGVGEEAKGDVARSVGQGEADSAQRARVSASDDLDEYSSNGLHQINRSRHWLGQALATSAVTLAIVLPAFEAWGAWDHWPSW